MSRDDLATLSTSKEDNGDMVVLCGGYEYYINQGHRWAGAETPPSHHSLEAKLLFFSGLDAASDVG